MKFAKFFVNYSHDCRGPRRGMKYHPVWITSAETFVRCYRRSLIPPNYKSRCSSVGRYLPLTFSLLPPFASLVRLCPPLSLKKTMLLALRSVTVTREEGTIKRWAWPGGVGELFKYFRSPSEEWQIGRNFGEVTRPLRSPLLHRLIRAALLSALATIDSLFLSPDLPPLIRMKQNESYSYFSRSTLCFLST